jgi:hypothetical protein
MSEPPKQVGPERDVTLTGMLFPWRDDQPVLVHLTGDGTGTFCLPLFRDEDRLRAVLGAFGVPFASIKMVEDGPEFLESLPRDIAVIADLRITDEGRLRYLQIRR